MQNIRRMYTNNYIMLKHEVIQYPVGIIRATKPRGQAKQVQRLVLFPQKFRITSQFITIMSLTDELRIFIRFVHRKIVVVRWESKSCYFLIEKYS